MLHYTEMSEEVQEACYITLGPYWPVMPNSDPPKLGPMGPNLVAVLGPTRTK